MSLPEKPNRYSFNPIESKVSRHIIVLPEEKVSSVYDLRLLTPVMRKTKAATTTTRDGIRAQKAELCFLRNTNEVITIKREARTMANIDVLESDFKSVKRKNGISDTSITFHTIVAAIFLHFLMFTIQRIIEMEAITPSELD